jgi:hypothetical protein
VVKTHESGKWKGEEKEMLLKSDVLRIKKSVMSSGNLYVLALKCRS